MASAEVDKERQDFFLMLFCGTEWGRWFMRPCFAETFAVALADDAIDAGREKIIKAIEAPQVEVR